MVEMYGITAVLCTATQPSWKTVSEDGENRGTLSQYAGDVPLFPPHPIETYRNANHENWPTDGYANAGLAVNTRKQAAELYRVVAENGFTFPP
ncbi:MAG: hypothetical protein ACLS8R_07895 [Anaeromassilibacillus sp.]